MIIIFNYIGIALLILAIFGAWAVHFSLWALGLGQSGANLGALVAYGGSAVLLDLVCRSTGVINSSPRGWLRFIAPSSGGQIFFIPIWILAGGVLSYKLLRMLI
jgi:hypothetical protein